MNNVLHKQSLLLMAIAMLVVSSSSVSAKVTLASPFNDNMVLQRERAVPVWGWADPGEAVTITFAGQKKETKAGPDRKWQVTLDPLPANRDPADLTVTGLDKVSLKNVLVGEVWLCGGQSNMGLTLSGAMNAPQEIAAANYPEIRFFAAPASGALLPADKLTGGVWKKCTPETAAGFSGVAYFFGRSLHRNLKAPIGLIEFDRGATGIECWVPLEAYQASDSPALQQIAATVASWDVTTEIGRKAHEEALRAIARWVPLAKKAIQENLPFPPEPILPRPDPNQANPCEVFNGTIHPLIPYAFRGAVWYQGESNPGEGAIYAQKMKAMIRGWRTAWGQDEFPFYFVQLANEGNLVREPAEEENFRYVPVREAQRRVLVLKNTGMVVAIDLGEDTNGHPRNKKDVGERLALWTLASDHKQPITFSGPLYRGNRIERDHVALFFDHAGAGLMIGDKDGLEPVKEVPNSEMKQFSIAGADGKWYWADAKIIGETVVVRSARVSAPVKVRYAYSMNPRGPKLYSRDGLPAAPFRTDEW